MTRIPPWRLLALIAGGLGLAACHASSPDAAVAESSASALVVLAPVTVGTLHQQTVLYGAVISLPAALVAPTEALVGRIDAPVGTRVGAGALIAELNAAPTTSLDLVKANVDLRAATTALARARRLRADGLVGDPEVETARAAAATAQATVASLSRRAAALQLRAPAAGFVASIDANPGELVAAGARVATLARTDNLRVRFGADLGLARLLGPGQRITIAGNGTRGPLDVPIATVDPVVDPQTRLAGVYASLPPSAGIGVGEILTGTVSVGVGGAGTALSLPYAALLDDAGQAYVFVVAHGVAHRRDVVTGPIDGGRVGIVSGVAAGEQVVIQGNTAVADGMRVRTS